MGALDHDRNTIYREGIMLEIPVYQVAKIYAGSMVCVNSFGYAVPAADVSGYRFVGVAVKQADNSSGLSGAINVLVQTEGLFDFGASSISQSNLMFDMYVVDDQTFAASNSGNGVKCGKLLKYVSPTRGWLMIGR
jgi:hypothetical protein